MTYKELFEKFNERYPNTYGTVNDYRAYGYCSIIIWFNSGESYIVKYDIESDEFEINESN